MTRTIADLVGAERIGYVPPVDHEEAYYRSQQDQAEVAGLDSGALR